VRHEAIRTIALIAPVIVISVLETRAWRGISIFVIRAIIPAPSITHVQFTVVPLEAMMVALWPAGVSLRVIIIVTAAVIVGFMTTFVPITVEHRAFPHCGPIGRSL
jgi:hypothetical protein